MNSVIRLSPLQNWRHQASPWSWSFSAAIRTSIQHKSRTTTLRQTCYWCCCRLHHCALQVCFIQHWSVVAGRLPLNAADGICALGPGRTKRRTAPCVYLSLSPPLGIPTDGNDVIRLRRKPAFFPLHWSKSLKPQRCTHYTVSRTRHSVYVCQNSLASQLNWKIFKVGDAFVLVAELLTWYLTR